MATEAPDPRTFETWEDAFQYPIPVVRRLEQQLRNNAHDNREKLRSLVGASYRSLLHTAETIIDMEVRMGQVETKLAVVGQSCNSRGLERIANNAGKMDIHTRSRGQSTSSRWEGALG
ncbi:Vps51 domain containing protein [Pyrenophora tritici-repentis]|nr:Vps51 domain containing protein [Pyrenophora tritici-repentis]